MPTIHYPATGAVQDVSAKVLPFWTGPAGWVLGDPPEAAAKPRKPRKPAKAEPAPQTSSTPDVEDPDDDPGLGSSTTTPTEE